MPHRPRSFGRAGGRRRPRRLWALSLRPYSWRPDLPTGWKADPDPAHALPARRGWLMAARPDGGLHELRPRRRAADRAFQQPWRGCCDYFAPGEWWAL